MELNPSYRDIPELEHFTLYESIASTSLLDLYVDAIDHWTDEIDQNFPNLELVGENSTFVSFENDVHLIPVFQQFFDSISSTSFSNEMVAKKYWYIIFQIDILAQPLDPYSIDRLNLIFKDLYIVYKNLS